MIPRSLLVITQTELRLLTRQIGFKLYIALVSILAIVIVLNTDPHSNSLDSLVWAVNNLAFFQFPLITFVVAYHVTKKQSSSRRMVVGDAPRVASLNFRTMASSRYWVCYGYGYHFNGRLFFMGIPRNCFL